LWTEGLGRKLREQVQAAFSATPSIKTDAFDQLMDLFMAV
jgi:hypothetical protein